MPKIEHFLRPKNKRLIPTTTLQTMKKKHCCKKNNVYIMMILPTRLTSRTNSLNIFHRAITVNNISNIFVQLPIMMSLGKFLEAVLSQFNSVVELNFQNKENRRDWLPLSRAGMDCFRSGNFIVSPGLSSVHTCREKHGGTTPLRKFMSNF